MHFSASGGEHFQQYLLTALNSDTISQIQNIKYRKIYNYHIITNTCKIIYVKKSLFKIQTSQNTFVSNQNISIYFLNKYVNLKSPEPYS